MPESGLACPREPFALSASPQWRTWTRAQSEQEILLQRRFLLLAHALRRGVCSANSLPPPTSPSSGDQRALEGSLYATTSNRIVEDVAERGECKVESCIGNQKGQILRFHFKLRQIYRKTHSRHRFSMALRFNQKIDIFDSQNRRSASRCSACNFVGQGSISGNINNKTIYHPRRQVI